MRGLRKFGTGIAGLLRRYETPITDTVVGAVTVLGLAAAVSSATTQAGTATPASMNRTTAQVQQHKALLPAKPLKVESVSPDGSYVNGTDPVTVTFNSALSPQTKLPSLSPNIAGSWKIAGRTATFTPRTGFTERTEVRVTMPKGMTGLHLPAVQGTPTLQKTVTRTFETGWYSTSRLQQLLSQLGYLPMTFHPSDSSGEISSGDAKAQLSAAYDAPSGSFSWEGKYPAQLEDQWRGGQNNMLDSGAVRTFEYDHGLAMDGTAGPEVWSSLLNAVAKGARNHHGYAYALATQGSSGENLQVYFNGKEILYTAANTGVAGAPTADGTFPVFDRTPFQIMKGKNPDGSKYADPVHWISYFNGGDAIHGFNRAAYGYYQSDGCVEIPVSTAKWLYPYLTYGTLVTVQGPVA